MAHRVLSDLLRTARAISRIRSPFLMAIDLLEINLPGNAPRTRACAHGLARTMRSVGRWARPTLSAEGADARAEHTHG
eukprot:6730842-Prymnesium_polylepis.2